MSKTIHIGVAEMKSLKQFEVWFITGSQHLYGPDVLRQVDADSQQIAAFLDAVRVNSLHGGVQARGQDSPGDLRAMHAGQLRRRIVSA